MKHAGLQDHDRDGNQVGRLFLAPSGSEAEALCRQRYAPEQVLDVCRVEDEPARPLEALVDQVTT